ncbi:MAG: hypothetical protein H0X62_15415, partial [Bacteroidetes bacterium]|nr:hypothetical protein [Bacteroidota bacterium]
MSFPEKKELLNNQPFLLIKKTINLNKQEDLSGKALYDFYKQQSHFDLLLDTSYGETETVPLELFLKTPEQFSSIEQFSMNL